MVALLGAEVAAAGIGGAGAYLFLSRRKAPSKLEKALKLSAEELRFQLPPGMSQEPALLEQDRVAFKEAFLNNPDYKWIATLQGNVDPKSTHVVLDIVWYMVEVSLRFVERYGYLLVKRDRNGKFQGAIGLISPYKKWWRIKTHYNIAALSLGRTAVPEKLGCGKRYKAYQSQLNQKHHDAIVNGNGAGHWYIPIVGVVSNQQGKGVGRALVETATQLCPRPLYLASPDHSMTFFTKVGFALDHRFQLAAEGGNQDPERDIVYYNSMTCR